MKCGRGCTGHFWFCLINEIGTKKTSTNTLMSIREAELITLKMEKWYELCGLYKPNTLCTMQYTELHVSAQDSNPSPMLSTDSETDVKL